MPRPSSAEEDVLVSGSRRIVLDDLGLVPAGAACSADDRDGPVGPRHIDTTVAAHRTPDGIRDLVVQLTHSLAPGTTPPRGRHVHHVTAVARPVGHLLAHGTDISWA